MTKDKLKLLLGYRFDAAAEDEGCEGERRVGGGEKAKEREGEGEERKGETVG